MPCFARTQSQVSSPMRRFCDVLLCGVKSSDKNPAKQKDGVQVGSGNRGTASSKAVRQGHRRVQQHGNSVANCGSFKAQRPRVATLCTERCRGLQWQVTAACCALVLICTLLGNLASRFNTDYWFHNDSVCTQTPAFTFAVLGSLSFLPPQPFLLLDIDIFAYHSETAATVLAPMRTSFFFTPALLLRNPLSSIPSPSCAPNPFLHPLRSRSRSQALAILIGFVASLPFCGESYTKIHDEVCSLPSGRAMPCLEELTWLFSFQFDTIFFLYLVPPILFEAGECICCGDAG